MFKITAEERDFILRYRAIAADPQITSYVKVLKRIIKTLSNKKFQTEYKELTEKSKSMPIITKGFISQLEKFTNPNKPPSARVAEKWPEIFKALTKILGKGYNIAVRPNPAELNVLLKDPEKIAFKNFLKGKPISPRNI